MPGEPYWLIYPNLDLFAYDQQRQEVEIELLPTLQPPLQGSVRQHRVENLRALHINCTDTLHDGELMFKPRPLRCVETLHAHLLEQLTIDVGAVGKTWLLWGRLHQEEADPEAIAQQCYLQVALAPDANWQHDQVGRGRISGATLFELWHQPAASETASEQHVLICLLDYGQSFKVMESLYQPLLNLLGHRHSLLWWAARSQHRIQELQRGYERANQIVVRLQDQAQQPGPALEGLNQQLVQVLQLLHEYTRHLGDLQADLSAIANQLNSYRRSRHQLYALDPQCQLAVLQQFDRLAVKRYWRPLKQAWERLRLGVPCLENAVKMAEGAIAIEQLKSQQQLARTMVAASSSIGATTAAAVAIAPHLEPHATSSWQNFGRSGSTFILSLVAGALVGLGLWRGLPWLGRWGRKPSSRP